MPAAKKSLVEKLGVKEGFRMSVLNPPQNYYKTMGKLPENIVVMKGLTGQVDFIHFFAVEKKELESKFPALKRVLSKKGMIWISWPKRSSGVLTDLSESTVREIGLKNQLVDVKVAAINETWSGLKFVRRSRKRYNHEREIFR